MADHANRKEKQPLKRAKKQQTMRKASALTPLQFISRNPKRLEYI